MDKKQQLHFKKWRSDAVEGGMTIDTQWEYVQYSEYEKYDRNCLSIQIFHRSQKIIKKWGIDNSRNIMQNPPKIQVGGYTLSSGIGLTDF